MTVAFDQAQAVMFCLLFEWILAVHGVPPIAILSSVDESDGSARCRYLSYRRKRFCLNVAKIAQFGVDGKQMKLWKQST